MSYSSKSSGSEGAAAVDEKKRKRMESNRESARRSRQRKQRHLDDLVREVSRLQSQNGEFSGKMMEISGRFGAMEAANTVLRAEKERLARRLESLQSVIGIATVVKANHGVTSARSIRESTNGSNSTEFGGNGFSNADSCEMMNPWRQIMTMIPDPSPSMALMATYSGGMFPS